MDKRLIDAITKEIENFSSEDNYSRGRIDGYQWVIDRLKSGSFASDPIPSPTIKPGDKEYQCYACGEKSSSVEWNSETGSYLGAMLHFINLGGEDSDTFVCPKCGEEQPRHVVGEVSHD